MREAKEIKRGLVLHVRAVCEYLLPKGFCAETLRAAGINIRSRIGIRQYTRPRHLMTGASMED